MHPCRDYPRNAPTSPKCIFQSHLPPLYFVRLSPVVKDMGCLPHLLTSQAPKIFRLKFLTLSSKSFEGFGGYGAVGFVLRLFACWPTTPSPLQRLNSPNPPRTPGRDHSPGLLRLFVGRCRPFLTRRILPPFFPCGFSVVFAGMMDSFFFQVHPPSRAKLPNPTFRPQPPPLPSPLPSARRPPSPSHRATRCRASSSTR